MLSVRLAGPLALAAVLATAAACSSSTTDSSSGSSGNTDGTSTADGGSEGDGGKAGADGGSSSTDSSTSSFSCCLNGQFYGCASAEAVKKCSPTGGIAECMAMCAGNPTCLQECQNSGNGKSDTSQCTRTASRDSECASQCDDLHVRTDKTCTSNAGCTASEHCNGGKCYLSSAGAPCSSNDDCGSVAQCDFGCCKL